MNAETGISQVLLLDLDLADGGNDFARGATSENGGGITGGQGIEIDVAADFEGEAGIETLMEEGEIEKVIALEILLPILGLVLVVGIYSVYTDKRKRQKRQNATMIPITIIKRPTRDPSTSTTTTTTPTTPTTTTRIETLKVTRQEQGTELL